MNYMPVNTIYQVINEIFQIGNSINLHLVILFHFLFSVHDSKNGIATNNKYATIARMNQRAFEGESREFPVIRSRTDGSLVQSVQGHTAPPARQQIVEIRDVIPSSPQLHQAGSRKPVYDGVQHSDSHSFVESFPRYQPHKHYRKTPNKEEQDNLKKEKLYSPCLKESSV